MSVKGWVLPRRHVPQGRYHRVVQEGLRRVSHVPLVKRVPQEMWYVLHAPLELPVLVELRLSPAQQDSPVQQGLQAVADVLLDILPPRQGRLRVAPALRGVSVLVEPLRKAVSQVLSRIVL